MPSVVTGLARGSPSFLKQQDPLCLVSLLSPMRYFLHVDGMYARLLSDWCSSALVMYLGGSQPVKILVAEPMPFRRFQSEYRFDTPLEDYQKLRELSSVAADDAMMLDIIHGAWEGGTGVSFVPTACIRMCLCLSVILAVCLCLCLYDCVCVLVGSASASVSLCLSCLFVCVTLQPQERTRCVPSSMEGEVRITHVHWRVWRSYRTLQWESTPPLAKGMFSLLHCMYPICLSFSCFRTGASFKGMSLQLACVYLSTHLSTSDPSLFFSALSITMCVCLCLRCGCVFLIRWAMPPVPLNLSLQTPSFNRRALIRAAPFAANFKIGPFCSSTLTNKVTVDLAGMATKFTGERSSADGPIVIIAMTRMFTLEEVDTLCCEYICFL